MAYAGILGIFGIDPFLYGYWVMPLTIIFSAFTLVILFYQARRNKRYLGFCFVLATITIILLDKFYLDSGWIVYIAITALLASSIRLSNPQKSKNSCHC
jgi:general stress protein CsbA